MATMMDANKLCHLQESSRLSMVNVAIGLLVDGALRMQKNGIEGSERGRNISVSESVGHGATQRVRRRAARSQFQVLCN